MSKNPALAPCGKYIIAFEILRSEKESRFAEDVRQQQQKCERLRSHENQDVRASIEGRAGFIGGDWYTYIYNRLLEQQVAGDTLPDFSGTDLAFITFNYDRSLEQFFYESLRNSFTEVPEDRIVKSLNDLKILHVYGQIGPLRWQDTEGGVDYKPQEIDEALLQRAATNLRTIYEQKDSDELKEARDLLARADEIFFLGFGYARENMDILKLPSVIPSRCQVYGTAYGLIEEEMKRQALAPMHDPRKVDRAKTVIELGDVDCLMLLRKHL